MLAARPLVCVGVELEADLIRSAGDCRASAPNRRRVARSSNPMGRPKSRRSVGPGLSQSEFSPLAAATSRTAAARKSGKGCARLLARDDQCDNVEVLGGTFEELGEEQTAAANHDELGVVTLVR